MINRLVFVGSQLGLVDQSDISLLEGFQQLGCRVLAFDYRATTFIPRWLSRMIPKRLRSLSPRKLAGVEGLDSSASNKRFIALIKQFRPELVIALQAERLTPVALCEVRKSGSVLMNWMLDEPEGRIDPEVVPLYDCWMVWDACAAEWLRERGAKRVEHLPVACDPKRHYPVALSPGEKQQWASKICFVGGFMPNRAAFLSSVSDLGLSIWGPGWDRVEQESLRRCVRGFQALSRQEWLKAYSGADIVINIHSQGKEGLNLRVWEALAAGACLVSDYRADIDRFLGGTVETFTSLTELRQCCLNLLADSESRKRMAQEGRQHVLAQHTFRHRAEQILKWAAECKQAVS